MAFADNSNPMQVNLSLKSIPQWSGMMTRGTRSTWVCSPLRAKVRARGGGIVWVRGGTFPNRGKAFGMRGRMRGSGTFLCMPG
jgi:hypothetical protein